MKPAEPELTQFYSSRAYWRNVQEETLRFKKAVRLANILPNARVLDIGCRHGRLKEFVKVTIDYHGIDIAPEFAGENVTIADVSQGIDFPENSFGYVFCLEVIEHLKNPYFVLAEIRRVLKSDGYLVVSLPNPYHFKEIIWNILRMQDRQGHIFSFTRQITYRLLEFVGFEVIKTRGTYLFDSIGCNNLMTRSFIYLAQKK